MACALCGTAHADEPAGVLLVASVEGGTLERDGYLVVTPAVGVLTPWLDLELGFPVELLVLDLEPADRSRALGGVLRSRGLVEDGALTPAAFSQVLRRARLGRPEDLFSLRAGQVQHSLGHGGTLWRFASTPDVDRRHAGLVLRAGTDRIGAEGVLGDVLAPHQVSGARLYLRPLGLFADDGEGLTSFGQRLALGLGYAADFFAPLDPDAIAADGTYAASGATASIVHGLVDLELLLVDLETWTLASYTDASLRRSGGDLLGLGGELGGMTTLRLWAASLHLRAGLRVSTPGHRPAEFDAFYQIERVTAFGDGLPKATQASPGGLGGVAELEFELAHTLHLRFAVDDAPGADNTNLWLGTDLELGPLRAALALAQRRFEGPLGWIFIDDRSVALAELRFEVLGPLAVVGRYWRTLRRDGSRTPHLDNDLLVGLEVGWVLQ